MSGLSHIFPQFWKTKPKLQLKNQEQRLGDISHDINNTIQFFMLKCKQYHVEFQSKLNRDGNVYMEMSWKEDREVKTYAWEWGNIDEYIDILNCFGNTMYNIRDKNYLQTIIGSETNGRKIIKKS